MQSLLVPTWLEQMQERSGDLAWRLMADHKPERRVILVDIDDRSLREIGPWPWPRNIQAQLIHQLAASGASLQIFDVVFTDQRNADEELVRAVQKHQPVLAQVFALEQGGQPSGGKLSGALDWPACAAPFYEAEGYLANFEGLSSPWAGHITPRVAPDGLVRQQPAIICFDGKAYPALSLAAVMAGSGARSLVLKRGTGLFEPDWQLGSAAMPQDSIPLDARGDLRVSWRLHPDSFISLSAADVLAGRIPSDLLTGAWVLVGGTAFGLNDSIATPFGGSVAGLQVHAQIMAALIDGRTPYTPKVAGAVQLLAAALGVAALMAMRRKQNSIYLMPLAALVVGALLWLLHAQLLTRTALWIGWANPAFYIVAAGFFMGVFEHARSRFDRDRLYAHLSSYLPAPVAAALALQPPSSAIKASTQNVSVMVADIRNFSRYLDARPPEEAAAVLHAFFSVATRVVQAHGGVIESFHGDAVIAVWNGVPGSSQADTTDHARRALQAALHLQQAICGVLPDPAPAGLEPLALGIGVETGPAMAGSFGLASRRTHMVMGRAVTVASRLVEMTAELAHPILVGEGLAGQLGGVGLESMGTFLLEGMRTPHHIYACPLVGTPGS